MVSVGIRALTQVSHWLPGFTGGNRVFVGVSGFSGWRDRFCLAAKAGGLPSSMAGVGSTIQADRSELALSRRIHRLYLPESFDRQIPLHHFYRALDYVHREKDRFGSALFNRLTNLFSLKLSLIFYDLTSSWTAPASSLLPAA